jgi:crotonobetainyl-CoA:carnitine CoA-transferase CaiB-like acyl-CoA transferase
MRDKAGGSGVDGPRAHGKTGASTIEILKEHGYSEEEINRFVAEKAVSISWGKRYLPD